MSVFIGPAITFIICFFIFNLPLVACLVGVIAGIFAGVLMKELEN